MHVTQSDLICVMIILNLGSTKGGAKHEAFFRFNKLMHEQRCGYRGQSFEQNKISCFNPAIGVT